MPNSLDSNPTTNGNGRRIAVPVMPNEPLTEADVNVKTNIKTDTQSSETLSETTLTKAKKRPPLSILIGLGTALLVGGGFGLRWWQYASTHEITDDAQLQGHVYEVSSRVSGTIQQVAVADNETVTAGQLLVQLNPQDFQSAVDQAQAALEIAQQQAKTAQISIAQASANANAQTTSAQGGLSGASAGIAEAQATLDSAQAGVPVAQAALEAANATLQKAQTEAVRYQDLFTKGAVSAEDRDQYQQAYQVAQAQQTQAQQQVQQAQAKVIQAQAGIAKAQSQLQASRGTLQQAGAAGLQTEVNSSQYATAQNQIKQAEASLKSAQLQLSYTQIKAPDAGVVGNKSVEPGDQVQVGQPLMAVVGQNFWVMANFKETQVADIRPGDPVTLTVDALGKETLTGKVQSLSPASGSQFSLLPPDNATGNFTKVVQRIPVKISLDPDSIQGDISRLSPGMSATVSVDISQSISLSLIFLGLISLGLAVPRLKLPRLKLPRSTEDSRDHKASSAEGQSAERQFVSRESSSTRLAEVDHRLYRLSRSAVRSARHQYCQRGSHFHAV